MCFNKVILLFVACVSLMNCDADIETNGHSVTAELNSAQQSEIRRKPGTSPLADNDEVVHPNQRVQEIVQSRPRLRQTIVELSETEFAEDSIVYRVGGKENAQMLAARLSQAIVRSTPKIVAAFDAYEKQFNLDPNETNSLLRAYVLMEKRNSRARIETSLYFEQAEREPALFARIQESSSQFENDVISILGDERAKLFLQVTFAS